MAPSNSVFAGSGGGSGKSLEMASLGGPSNHDSQSLLALTPHYCAPERLLRTDLSFGDLQASDVYTYGACAWGLVVLFTRVLTLSRELPSPPQRIKASWCG